MSKRPERRETIKNLLGADYYNISLRGTKWRSGEGHIGDENVIASVQCQKNGVYTVTSDVLNLSFPTMAEAEASLLDVLELNHNRNS